MVGADSIDTFLMQHMNAFVSYFVDELHQGCIFPWLPNSTTILRKLPQIVLISFFAMMACQTDRQERMS